MTTDARAHAHLRRFLLASLVIIGGVLALVYFAQMQVRHAREAWPRAPIQILDERTIVTQVYSDHREGEIFYQGEVRARYSANGREMNVWLPAMNASPDRDALEHSLRKLADKGCYVRWNPDYAEDVNLVC